MPALIIMPVKPFAESKRRLADVLTPDTRIALSRGHFLHVLALATARAPAAATLVISRSDDVLALARAAGAQGLAEVGQDHNAAIRQGLRHAAMAGHAPVLVLSSDLPLLQDDDLAAMLALRGDVVGIAPDRMGQGTNALFLPRPDRIAPCFGPGSRAAHETAARRAGAGIAIVERRGLATDIDTPADLDFPRSA